MQKNHEAAKAAAADVINSAQPLPLQDEMAGDETPKYGANQDAKDRPGYQGNEQIRRKVELPADSPVQALGKLGDTCFYLDGNNQLIELRAKDHSRLNVISLFGPHTGLMQEYFPKFNKDGDLTGTDYQYGAEMLLKECAREGVWNPAKLLRGRGAWRGDKGELIWHCGNKILIGRVPDGDVCKQVGHLQRPGTIDGIVYPGLDPIDLPADRKGRNLFDAAAEVFELIKTWNFQRGEVDARLLIGWIGCAMLSGALDWRPLVWLTGGQGTGKSTLQTHVITPLFGGGIVATSDSTAAGIWQELGYDALPVAFDELEAESNSDQAQKVLKLARQASSGGVMMRGGQSHTGSKFTIRSCFLFASILIPALNAQDRSRMAILNLDPIPRGRPMPDLAPVKMKRLGADMRHNLARAWGRWHKTLDHYRIALGAQGHVARGADQFGALLAMADMMMEPGLPGVDDRAEAWAHDLAPNRLSELDGLDGNVTGCLTHLLSHTVEINRERRALGAVLYDAWKEKIHAPYGGPDIAGNFAKMNTGLKGHGVMLKVDKEGVFVAVACQHSGLSKIFAGTHWASHSGAIGVWVQAMERIDGATRPRSGHYFSGTISRVVLIPIKHLKFEEEYQEEMGDDAQD